MIEATCTTCGNINRVQEADLPAGAKFLTCTSCKSRVGLPASIPASPSSTRPGSLPSALAEQSASGGRPGSSGLDLDFVPDALYSSVDLPAPKGALPPRSLAQPSQAGITDLPAPKVRRQPMPDTPKSQSAPAQIVDLPAPKAKPTKLPAGGPPSSGTVSRPPPRPILDLPAPRTRGIGDLPPSAIGGLGDLPAPKRTGPITANSFEDLATPRSSPSIAGGKLGSGPDLPAPKLGSGPDLPAPKTDTAVDLPAPKPAGTSNLPAPKYGRNADLPAPKQAAAPDPPAARNAPVPDLPTPRPIATAPDLPAPRRSAPPELPAPKQAAAPDLPAPRAQAGPPDLPAPRRHAAAEPPAPKPNASPDPSGARRAGPDPSGARRSGPPDLPAPRQVGGVDLPAPRAGGPVDPTAPKPGATPDLHQHVPKGFFDDLLDPLDPEPAPSAATADLPAPMGFFDDLPGRPAATKPQPAEPPAPKGFFDDLPGRPPATKPQPAEAPAPKGFFDDLPGRPAPTKPQPAEAPAPKGFFDDLPGRPAAAKPQPAEPPAPKGFFNDRPDRDRPDRSGPARAATPDLPGFFDDLPGPPPGAPAMTVSSSATPPPTPSSSAEDRSRPQRSAESSRPARSAPEERPSRASRRAAAASLDGGDSAAPAELSTPVSGRYEHLEQTKPARPSGALRAAVNTPRSMPAVTPPPGASQTSKIDAEPGDARASASSTSVGRMKAEASDRAAPPRRRTWRLALAAVGVSVLVAAGVGGLFLYRRHAQEQERIEAIQAGLAEAREAFEAKDPKHWDRAASAARSVQNLDPKHPAAIGLEAEALLADSLAYGIKASEKAVKARKILADAYTAGLTGPEIERAQALSAATNKQPSPAALEKLATARPADLHLALYLGWARMARGDVAAAAADFTRALPSDALKIPALYGRARAKLALADLAGARDDFGAILAIHKDHIAAQVGLAAAMPIAQAAQQEADLLAILQRKDLSSGDPRSVLEAWVLAAEAARRTGRIPSARERYGNALKLAPRDASVLAGLADVELADGKLELAGNLIEQALAIEPSHVHAQLISAELAIRQKRLDDASSRLQALRTRKPPLPNVEQARLTFLQGKILEAQGQDRAAADEFVTAAKLAGDTDRTAALAAIAKLGVLAEAAEQARDADQAIRLRGRADQLITGLTKQAQKDPKLALALGQAFLQSNDGGRAEPWLRIAADAQPNQAEPRYPLAKALVLLGRTEDAIEELQRASKLDGRAEAGLELARIYEATRRDAAAGEIYAELLAGKEPSAEVRASAGRFFARQGEIAKAAEQGQLLLATGTPHPAGWYLQGEGQLAAGRLEEAAKSFRAAVDSDPDPQYLEAQGRAAEMQAAQTGDSKYLDAALRSYMAAAVAAPTMLKPLLGQGRIYVARDDPSKAIPPLLAASKLAPDHPEVARLIGMAYKAASEPRVAVEWLARAHRLAPSAETAWYLGQLHSELNAPREAIAALTSATRLAIDKEKKTGVSEPWLTEALYKLGRIHMDSGNERAAKSAWEKYVGRKPKPGPQLDEVRRELMTTLQRY